MPSVKEGITDYTFPCGFHRGVAWFKRGVYGMKGKVKIDEIIARRYGDLSEEIRNVMMKMFMQTYIV